MLIISKFRDYYDSVAFSKGVDKTIVYKREITELLDKKLANETYSRTEFYFPEVSYNSVSDRNIKSMTTSIIGFCGKLYPVMVIERDVRVSQYSTQVQTEIVYDIEVMREFHDKYVSRWNHNFDDYLSLLKNKEIENIFYAYKVPSFILKEVKVNYVNRGYKAENNLMLNPCLKDIEFYKVMDSSRAFQEIEMYISGVLGTNEKNTVEVSDKSKIEGHGFDYKTSFRKEGKKK